MQKIRITRNENKDARYDNELVKKKRKEIITNHRHQYDRRREPSVLSKVTR